MTPDEQVIYIKRQDEMNRIANFARAYANATPEQRARIPREDVLFQIERYKNLQNQQRLAEDKYQAQLAEQYRQQEAQANQPINTRWLWRKAPKQPTTPIVEPAMNDNQYYNNWLNQLNEEQNAQNVTPTNEIVNNNSSNEAWTNWQELPVGNVWVIWNTLLQWTYNPNYQYKYFTNLNRNNNSLLQWTYNPNARYTIWWQQLSWTVYWPITNRTYPSTTQFWRQYPLLGGSNRIAPYYNNGSYTIWWQPLNS